MAKGKRGFISYKCYLFRDQDPIVGACRTARSDSRMTFQQIRDEGGPTVSTLRAWEMGKTMRPQFATIAAGTRAMGKNIIDLSGGKPRIR